VTAAFKMPPRCVDAPMSPGTYLRKRREAAGLSLDLAALAFVPWNTLGTNPGNNPGQGLGVMAEPPGGKDLAGIGPGAAVRATRAASVAAQVDLVALVRTIAAKIAELEADQRHVDRSITLCLARIVPLDVDIYDALVARHLGIAFPLPQVCRQCACSWHHPCSESVESGIAGCFAVHGGVWSETDPGLCTRCEANAAAPAAPAAPVITENTDAS